MTAWPVPLPTPACVVLRQCIASSLLGLFLAGCQGDVPAGQKTSDAPRENSSIKDAELQAAIDRSARYLANACDEDGKFAYRVHLDPSVEFEPSYNVLRHAGSVYALAQYCQRSPQPRAKAAMLRAAEFLRRRCIGPAAGNPNFLAAWSDPELVGGQGRRQAKLGGTGLALVALLSVEQVEPGFSELKDLRKLGRFIGYLQKLDGSFYSKFYPENQRDDSWQSMYYPGEAALGLLMLYRHDPAPHWLRSATQAMEHLARRGAQQDPTLPDQWYLLALEVWMQLEPDARDAAVQKRLLEHARHLCRDMVAEQQGQLENATINGCFTPEGRTCPSATRLEGLLAAQTYLPHTDETLSKQVGTAITRGVPFLLESQVIEGRYAGAFPRFKCQVEPVTVAASERNRMREVRIDYVQHALSALLAYERQLSELLVGAGGTPR